MCRRSGAVPAPQHQTGVGAAKAKAVGQHLAQICVARGGDQRQVARHEALVHLVARLNRGGFGLLDAQFVNPHLERLGAIAMPRAEYHKVMEPLLARDADFFAFKEDGDPEAVLAWATTPQSSG